MNTRKGASARRTAREPARTVVLPPGPAARPVAPPATVRIRLPRGRSRSQQAARPEHMPRQLRPWPWRAILGRTMAARPVIAAAVSRALSSMGIDVSPASVHLERPARRDHGDWSTNTALVNAKALGRPPRQLAEELGRAPARRSPSAPRIGRGGGAGIREPAPLAGVAARHPHRGRQRRRSGVRPKRHRGRGERPDRIHLGQPDRSRARRQRMVGCLQRRHGTRHGTRSGWQVHREYYVNDTGGQIRVLGESLLARRRGEAVPEEGYQGEYVTELAGDLRRPRRRRGSRAVGGGADPRQHPGHARAPRDRVRRVVQPGVGRGERCGARHHRAPRRARAWSTRRTEPSGSVPRGSGTTATACS